MANNRNQRNQTKQDAPPPPPATGTAATIAAAAETTVGTVEEPPGVEQFELLDPRTVAQPGAPTPPPPAPAAAAGAPQPSSPAPPRDPVDDAFRAVMIEVPTLRGGTGYVTRSLGRRQLSPAQAGTLREVVNALSADGARLESGRAVAEPDDAIAWLLERIAGVLGVPPHLVDVDPPSRQ